MSPTTRIGIARAIGLGIGLAIAALLVLAARPNAHVSGLPAAVRFAALPSGELALTPPAPRPVLTADSLRPGGGRAQATFEVRNQTGRTMMVGFRARPDSTALDGLLRVRLSAPGRTLANTTLQGLRRGSESTPMPSGAARRLRLEAWIPDDVSDDYEGRRVNVSLVATISPVGG